MEKLLTSDLRRHSGVPHNEEGARFGPLQTPLAAAGSFAPEAAGRLQGYKRALEASGLPFDDPLVGCGDGTARGGYRLAAGLMRAPDPPTAIFCGNDQTAMGTYEALEERGLRIPEDVAVVGFDNQEIIAAHIRPALSTVALPHHEMGRWAVEYLIDGAARGETPPTRRAIACPYVERESV